jgi:hypothetical protein
MKKEVKKKAEKKVTKAEVVKEEKTFKVAVDFSTCTNLIELLQCFKALGYTINATVDETRIKNYPILEKFIVE